jgi:hypothetical protein
MDVLYAVQFGQRGVGFLHQVVGLDWKILLSSQPRSQCRLVRQDLVSQPAPTKGQI